MEGSDFTLEDGDIVIAAITSCTNTSNPSVLVAAGMLARNANRLGLKVPPWVKTSLAPGSKVVTDYLEAAGLQERPEHARFQPRRLRMHHLHRQLRAAARRDQPRHRPGRTDGGVGAVGQPQLRGPDPSADPRQLSGVAAAGGGLRAGRLHEEGPAQRSAGHRRGRTAGLSPRHLAGQRRHSGDDRGGADAGHVPRPLRRRLPGRRGVAATRGADGTDLHVAGRVHLRPSSHLLRGRIEQRVRQCHRRPAAGHSRRTR